MNVENRECNFEVILRNFNDMDDNSIMTISLSGRAQEEVFSTNGQYSVKFAYTCSHNLVTSTAFIKSRPKY